MKQITLETVVDRAARRLGCRKALFTKIGISRQRVHSAVRGGPPLHVERLLRLSIEAGADPLETLRAGGRTRFAELLEEAARGRLGETSVSERALLREYRRLTAEAQAAVGHLIADLATIETERSASAEPQGEAPTAPSDVT